MAKYQVYPPELRDRGVKVYWVRIVDDDGRDHLRHYREYPGAPIDPGPGTGSHIQRAQNIYRAFLFSKEEEGFPQTDEGKMTVADPDYNG